MLIGVRGYFLVVWFALPWQRVTWSTLSYAGWPPGCLLQKKCLLKPSAHFLTRFLSLLSCMSSFYNLDISPLSHTWFASTLSRSIGRLFILWMVFLAVQKGSIVDVVPLVYLCFHCFSFWCRSINTITKTDVKVPFPVSSSRSFMVSVLVLRSSVHFEMVLGTV